MKHLNDWSCFSFYRQHLNQSYHLLYVSAGEFWKINSKLVNKSLLPCDELILLHLDFPYLLCLICGGNIIADVGSESADNGIINNCLPVCGKEQNTPVIFKQAQEYADNGILLYAITSLMNIYIGFIDQ